jgi:prepilin-type N-terminal cleavage/methylation domain-containing protein
VREHAVKIKSSRGFSLLEVIIVLALITVAASIAVPNFRAYRHNTNLKEAARDISSDIALYKQRAVSENRGYRINFSTAANTYTIQQEVVTSGVRTGNYIDLETKIVGAGNATIVILGTPSFSGGVSHVTLNPRGTSGAGKATLQNTKSLSTAVITTNLMGRVKVEYDLK